MTSQTGARYGAYHRISRLNGRDLDVDTTMTDKAAFEQMDAWATLRGVTIAERYLDSDVSGSKLRRPELDRMLADLEAGRIDGVVVAQVDRLSRADVGDALAVVRQVLDRAPGRLALLDLGIDPSTEFGEFGLTVLLALGRMQWRRYRRTWSVAQARAIKRGVWVGATPFGYRTTVAGHDKHGKPVTGPLEPDPETAEIVSEAFRIAASDGLHAAMAHLQAAAPYKRWRTVETRRLLSSRVYLGEIVLGELHNRDAHDPLTTVDTWQAAQTEPQARRSNGDYPLSGLASCGKCGEPLVGALQSVRGKRYRRMRCSNPECRGGSSISADKLETHVRETLREALGDRTMRLRFVPHGVEAARRALELAESDRKRYAMDLDIRGILGEEAWRAGAAARSEAVEEARMRYMAIAGQAAVAEQLPAADQLDDDEQLVRAVRAMVAGLVVQPGRGSVDQRVAVAFLNLNDGAGVLAA